MSLLPGTRLGPYEIVEQVGAGGMGEVYRAKDTRLERIVAIKILPSHLSTNAQLRQRFEREAKTISSISHPHICSLYDIGQQDGVDFLVMEFLEGETVAERLQKGALPFEQTLKYGIEIADALEKAHKQGIVHRDLKPGNIMITKSGVKLLDFGLAKLQASVLSPPFTEVSALQTQRPDLTAEGAILGTIQYMAPEQLEAGEVDARTDIHALGVVLYEMATGRRAFSGKSQASLIAAILSSEPPSILSTQPLAPPAFENVVKTCMAKDPDDRWQTAHDVKLELKWIHENKSQANIAAPLVVQRRKRYRFAVFFLILGLMITTGTLLVMLLGKSRPLNSFGQIRFRLPAPPESPQEFTYVGDIASVSPNGQHIVYVRTTADARSQLWLRSVKKTSWEPIAGTESGISPFWSPDSREIAFFADGRLKKINLASGSVRSLCSVSSRGIANLVSGSWGAGGTILFMDNEEGFYSVLSSGGPSKLIRKDVFWPHFLPDGRHFLCLFAEEFGKSSYQLSIGNLDSKELRKLMPIASSVAYADPGHLLYIRDTTLLAHPFDAKTMRFTGEPSPVAEQVGSDRRYAWSLFSVSQNGLLLYFPFSFLRLVWLDRNGHEIGTVAQPDNYGSFSISPDGRKVAVGIGDPQVPNEQDLWIYDLERGTRVRFTHSPGLEYKPIWSFQGNQIVFTSERDSSYVFLLKELNSNEEGRQFLPSAKDQRADDWSPDGRYVIFTRVGVNDKPDLWVQPLTEGGKTFNFTQSPFFEYWGKFSPDGKWVAFVSDEAGSGEVYVTAFPNAGEKIRVSTAGGDEPRWSKDGKEMFYREGQYMVSVPVKLGSTIELGKPARLFRVLHQVSFYDIAPDGQRFLITVHEGADAPMTVVLNWMEELKRN